VCFFAAATGEPLFSPAGGSANLNPGGVGEIKAVAAGDERAFFVLLACLGLFPTPPPGCTKGRLPLAAGGAFIS